MARSNHMKALIRAFNKRDDKAFVGAANNLIAEEKAKGHNLLARDLARLLDNGRGDYFPVRFLADVPIDKERGLPLAHVEKPELGWERIVLTPVLLSTLNTIVDEFRRREVLRSYGLRHKEKLLFFGPPGCGKSITARVLAGVLDLPLLYVRFDAVVSSYLGETASNLRRVFDFAERGSWVVLFDEFDAIGKAREDSSEHGELKRVVNTLLQLMDGFSGDSLLIAATNHAQLLDVALWRRFDEICFFERPNSNQRRHLFIHFLSGFRLEDVEIKTFSDCLEGMTGGDIERICLDAAKTGILAGRDRITTSDLDIAIERQRERIRLTSDAKGEAAEPGNAKRT